jgi:hypothetical protein
MYVACLSTLHWATEKEEEGRGLPLRPACLEGDIAGTARNGDVKVAPADGDDARTGDDMSVIVRAQNKHSPRRRRRSQEIVEFHTYDEGGRIFESI